MSENATLGNAREALSKRIDDIVDGARARAIFAADQVADGKKPVRMLSDVGIQLSRISHKTTDRFIRQQAKILSNSIDAIAGRFQAAAAATSVRDLVVTQARLVPENTARLVNDTRDALGIVVDAGAEVRGVVTSTVSELRGKPAKPARKPAAKAPAKKAAAKKATAKKAPAKKARAKKATVRKTTTTKTAPRKPVTAKATAAEAA